MSDPVLSLLKQLVAIDSVNPSLVPGAAGEAQIAEAVAAHLRTQGFDVTVQEAAPGRPNVVGVLEGRQPGRSLMFCGHLDTVGVEGMAAPFDPVERDGRIYGRGSQDMKGGVAAMIDAARLVKDRGLPRGRLVVACVIDEEFMSLGADALVREWTADAAIVTEPTDLQIGVGHKGFAWFEIETRGRAAHGSRPADGRDAILRMGRVLHRLEALDAELQARTPHPVMGVPSLHASAIEGGGEWSVYPDRCRLRLERRTVAGETASGAGERAAENPRGPARRGPGVRGIGTRRVRAPAVRGGAGCTAGGGRARGRRCHADSAARNRHELLDRRRDSRGRRHPVGGVRARRGRPSRRRGVRQGE
jgi:acetylornithine deacetylase